MLKLISDLGRDNIRWLVPVISVVGVGVTFALGGVAWGIGGVIFVLVLAVAALTNTLRRIEQRGGDVAASASAGDEPLVDTAPELSADPQDASRSEAPEANLSTPSEDPVIAAIEAAYLTRDSQAVATSLESYIQASSSAADRVEREAFKYFLQSKAGSPSGLAGLRTLVEANPTLPAPLLQLSRALSELGETQAAIATLRTARAEHPEVDQPRVRLEESALLRKVGDPQRSLALVRDALLTEGDSGERGALLKENAYALEQLGRTHEAMAFFELAVDSLPLDRQLRFHLAYLYSSESFPDLAIDHYLILLNFAPDDATARNNLAVDLGRLEMPAMSVDSFKQAVRDGSALAAGNLAHLALDNGFVAEAEEWVSAGANSQQPHSRVSSATFAIATRRETETKMLEDSRRRANDLRAVLRNWNHAIRALPIGQWRFSTGHVADFAVKGSTSMSVQGEDADRVEITVTADAADFELKIAVGRFGLTSYSGRATRTEAGLAGYLRGWPTRGITTAVTASEVNPSG